MIIIFLVLGYFSLTLYNIAANNLFDFNVNGTNFGLKYCRCLWQDVDKMLANWRMGRSDVLMRFLWLFKWNWDLLLWKFLHFLFLFGYFLKKSNFFFLFNFKNLLNSKIFNKISNKNLSKLKKIRKTSKKPPAKRLN